MQATLHKYRCTVRQPGFILTECEVTAHTPEKAAELAARAVAVGDDTNGDFFDVIGEPECDPNDCEVAA